MRNKEAITAESRQRLHPHLFNSRYYHLRQLKKTIITIINKYIKDKETAVLIDQGCGSMPYKSLFESHLKKYIGADIAENTAANIQIENGRVATEDDFADIVLSTQVLEHVTDPNCYLTESHRILKKEGLLILSTHGIWRYHPDPTDYWRWTADGLQKIVEEKGFDIIEIRGIMGMASIGMQLFQDAFLYKLPKPVTYPFVFIMQLIIALFDKVHSDKNRKKDACVFFIIAKKK